MAYQALYRSYRPLTFNQVIGQENIIKTIRNAITSGKTSHAYIFSGPRGTGKTTIARIFAKAINCDNSLDGEPCNQCDKCLSVLNEQTTDIIELDAASNNGVEEMRNLLEKVNFLPGHLKTKVYIIDEVHMLSLSAFNALLKTLEEPPKHVMFILATTEPHKIPLTIHSRCQRFDFKPLTRNQIFKVLKDVSEKEEIIISDDAINGLAEAAEGGMRDALGMLDQVSAYTNEEITLIHVDSVTGRISNYQLIRLINSFSQKNVVTSLEIVEELIESGKEIPRIILGLIQTCRDILLYQTVQSPDTHKLIFDVVEFQTLANNVTKKQIFKYLDILIDLQNKIKWTTAQKIYLEVSIMKILNQGDDAKTVTEGEVLHLTEYEDRLALVEQRVRQINDAFSVLNSKIENLNYPKIDELKQGIEMLENESKLIKSDVEEKFEILDIIHDVMEKTRHEIESLKSNQSVKIDESSINERIVNAVSNQIGGLKQQIILELEPRVNSSTKSEVSHDLFSNQPINYPEELSLLMVRLNAIEQNINQQTSSSLIDDEEFYELKDNYINIYNQLGNLTEKVQTINDQFIENQKFDYDNLSNTIDVLEKTNNNQQEEITRLREDYQALKQQIQNVSAPQSINKKEIENIIQSVSDLKDYSIKLGAKIQQIEDSQKLTSPKTNLKEEVVNISKPQEEKTVVVKTKPQTQETVVAIEASDETSKVYDVKRIEIILHESREQKARDEKIKIMNSWKRLNERVSVYLAPIAQHLMEGQFVVNGLKDILIVYPSAQICNFLMEDKVHDEAKQVLKNALNKDMDFIALPESVWQEKRKEYHGQYYMGIKYPTLTPINNPELKIIKTSKETITLNKSVSEKKAEELFGPKLIKREV